MDSGIGQCNATLMSLISEIHAGDYILMALYLLVEIIIAIGLAIYRWRVLKTPLSMADELNMGRRKVNSMFIAAAVGLTGGSGQDITDFYGQAGKSLTNTLARSIAFLICTPLWLLFRRRGYTAGNYIFARFQNRSWSVFYCLFGYLYLIHRSTACTSNYISSMISLGYEPVWANAAAYCYAAFVFAVGGIRCICYLGFIRLTAIFWTQIAFIIEGLNRFPNGTLRLSLTETRNNSFWYIKKINIQNGWHSVVNTPISLLEDVTHFGITHIGLSYIMAARNAKASVRSAIASIIVFAIVSILNDVSANLVYLYYQQKDGCDPVAQDRIPPFSMMRLYFFEISKKKKSENHYFGFHTLMASPGLLHGSFHYFSVIIAIWLQMQADILLPLVMHDIVEVNPYRFTSIICIGIILASFVAVPTNVLKDTIAFIFLLSFYCLAVITVIVFFAAMLPPLSSNAMWFVLVSTIPTLIVYFLKSEIADPRNSLFVYSGQFVVTKCKLTWNLNRTGPVILISLFGCIALTIFLCIIFILIAKKSRLKFDEKLYFPISAGYWKEYYKHVMREMKQKKLRQQAAISHAS